MATAATIGSGRNPLGSFRIGDILVTVITIATQILIARRFISDRKRLAPATARAVGGTLCCLWAACLFATPFRFPELVPEPTPSPTTRDLLIAIGNAWSILSVPSFGIYVLVARFATGQAPKHSPERRRLIHAAGTAAVAAPFAVGAFGAVVERTDFQVKEVDLPVPNLHPDLEGFRIGQLSDLHVSPWLSVRDAGRVVDMLNECRPHLTVVTGDVITREGDPLDAALRELGRLRADEGVLGCLGNHERYARCQAYETREAAKYGISILRNRARAIRRGGASLNIAGIDYQSRRDGPYLTGAEHLIVPGSANILLSHNPDTFPVAVAKGYDAVISGHTHGGQVTVEILNRTLNFARFVTPFVAGLYRIDGRSCYVTAGIGTIALPVRIGAPPEITVLRLIKA